MNNLRKPFSSPESSLRLYCSTHPPLVPSAEVAARPWTTAAQKLLDSGSGAPEEWAFPHPIPPEAKGQDVGETECKEINYEHFVGHSELSHLAYERQGAAPTSPVYRVLGKGF